MAAQEAAPGSSRPPTLGGGRHAVPLEDVPDRGAPDPIAQLRDLAVDAAVAPARVLPASRTMSASTSAAIGGRPVGPRRAKVHLRRTSSRCHCKTVSGLTSRTSWSNLRRGPAARCASLAARTARVSFSQRERRGRGCRRCNSRTWCCRSRISRCLSRSGRRAAATTRSTTNDTGWASTNQAVAARPWSAVGAVPTAADVGRSYCVQDGRKAEDGAAATDGAADDPIVFPHSTGCGGAG